MAEYIIEIVMKGTGMGTPLGMVERRMR